jgi:hypothetical protein
MDAICDVLRVIRFKTRLRVDASSQLLHVVSRLREYP